MRISVKARYGLSTMICLAQYYITGEYITIISLAEKLKISKIYLEQVFSLLKRSKLVISAKGAQGGYRLARTPKEITALDILSAIELSLFEKTEFTILESEEYIEKAMQAVVFEKLNQCIKDNLAAVSLQDLVEEANKHSSDEGYMYYL